MDTSVVVGVLLGEPGVEADRRRLRRFDRLVSGDLFRAELASVARREDVDLDAILRAAGDVAIVLPDRSLESEMRLVLEAGHLRGADLWHVACALYVGAENRGDLAFLTSDDRQREVARSVGLRVPQKR